MALLVVLFLLDLLCCGIVDAAEFCPQTFEHRQVRYYRSNLLGVQVTPASACPPWRTPLGTYLASQGYLDAASKPEWLTIKAHCGGQGFRKGRGYWLCKHLRCDRGQDQEWVDFSRAEPELAARVWPAVIRLANAGNDEAVAQVLFLARSSRSADDFAQALAKYEARY